VVCCFPQCAGRDRPNDAITYEPARNLEAADMRLRGVVVYATECAQLPLHHIDVTATLA
jgi:hypothetical protein